MGSGVPTAHPHPEIPKVLPPGLYLSQDSQGCSKRVVMGSGILRDPGATSGDDAISLGESLLQELKSPWELILTEPVPEEVEFRPADWAEKYISAQSAMRSS